MNRAAFLLVLAAAAAGCRMQPPHEPPASAPSGTWAPAAHTHVQVGVQNLCEIANNGLFLPAATRDARLVAWLRVNAMEQGLPASALAGGSALEGVSLHVRPATVSGAPATVVDARVASPAWSADGARLAFLAWNTRGLCFLGVYDRDSGKTTYTQLPGDRAMMPAFSPTGRHVALALAAKGSPLFRVHVVDLAGGPVLPWPAPDPQAAQYWPQWTSDGQLLCLYGHKQRVRLAAWTPGTPAARAVCDLRVANSPAAAYAALAAIAAPLAPDGRRFAYYQQESDRIVLVDLADARETPLDEKTRAGCWFDARRFVAATDTEMSLVGLDGRSAILLQGPWLPRAASDGRLLACTAGRFQATFALALITVTAEGM